MARARRFVLRPFIRFLRTRLARTQSIPPANSVRYMLIYLKLYSKELPPLHARTALGR
jgi:hypothetical protein